MMIIVTLRIFSPFSFLALSLTDNYLGSVSINELIVEAVKNDISRSLFEGDTIN